MGFFNKKQKEPTEGFNSRMINVVVEKVINGNLVQEVAEFIAIQDKSDSKSLVIREDNLDFIEELDFTENELITVLKQTLEFKGKDKKEKIAVLEKNIQKQTEKIKKIKKGRIKVAKKKDGKTVSSEPEDKEKPQHIQVNRIDEERKLRLLQVLKEHTQDYDDRGVYEIINVEGRREIRFLVVGDFLYPMYRSPNHKTIYPNMVSKKKVYKLQYDLARKEFDDAITSKIADFFKKIQPLLSFALLLTCIIWSVHLGGEKSKLQDTIQEEVEVYQKMLATADQRCVEASTKCGFYLSEFVKDNANLLIYANEQMRLLTLAMNSSIEKANQKQNSLRDQVVQKVIDEVVS